jgi:hypothetical protein
MKGIVEDQIDRMLTSQMLGIKPIGWKSFDRAFGSYWHKYRSLQRYTIELNRSRSCMSAGSLDDIG